MRLLAIALSVLVALTGLGGSVASAAQGDDERRRIGYLAGDEGKDWHLKHFPVPHRKVVGSESYYLTFDDAQTENTVALLDGLKAWPDVKITFFVNCYEMSPGVYQRILDEGHAIGNHTCNHVPLTELGKQGRTEQFDKLRRFVMARVDPDKAIGCYRPPFGLTSDSVRDHAWNSLDLYEWGWNVNTEDYEYPGTAAIQHDLDTMRAGDIALMHTSRGKSATVQATLSHLARYAGMRSYEVLPGCATYAPPLCQGRPATIVGTPKGDRIKGTSGDDVIWAGPGDDVVHALAGDDIVCGGGGSDVIHGGPGDDVLSGEKGKDVLRGGPGSDLLDGDTGADRLYGGRGSDTLRGRTGSDRLWGGPGADHLYGGKGADHLRGNAGDDRLVGGPGSDHLRGGKGADILRGGAGTDICIGGPGADAGHLCETTVSIL